MITKKLGDLISKRVSRFPKIIEVTEEVSNNRCPQVSDKRRSPTRGNTDKLKCPCNIRNEKPIHTDLLLSFKCHNHFITNSNIKTYYKKRTVHKYEVTARSFNIAMYVFKSSPTIIATETQAR